MARKQKCPSHKLNSIFHWSSNWWLWRFLSGTTWYKIYSLSLQLLWSFSKTCLLSGPLSCLELQLLFFQVSLKISHVCQMKQILNLKPELNIKNPGTFSHASLLTAITRWDLGNFPYFFKTDFHCRFVILLLTEMVSPVIFYIRSVSVLRIIFTVLHFVTDKNWAFAHFCYLLGNLNF